VAELAIAIVAVVRGVVTMRIYRTDPLRQWSSYSPNNLFVPNCCAEKAARFQQDSTP
jgi:hypothetical protein